MKVSRPTLVNTQDPAGCESKGWRAKEGILGGGEVPEAAAQAGGEVCITGETRVLSDTSN